MKFFIIYPHDAFAVYRIVTNIFLHYSLLLCNSGSRTQWVSIRRIDFQFIWSRIWVDGSVSKGLGTGLNSTPGFHMKAVIILWLPHTWIVCVLHTHTHTHTYVHTCTQLQKQCFSLMVAVRIHRGSTYLKADWAHGPVPRMPQSHHHWWVASVRPICRRLPQGSLHRWFRCSPKMNFIYKDEKGWSHSMFMTSSDVTLSSLFLLY